MTFKSHFLSGDFPELSEPDLDAAIKETSLETIEGVPFYERGESRKNFAHAGGMKGSFDRQPSL